MWQDFLGWYLAPWRRINRMTFNLVIGVAMIPGLLFSLTGFLGGAGGVLGPAMELMGAGPSAAVDRAGDGVPPDMAAQLAKIKGGMSGGMTDADVTRSVSQIMPHEPGIGMPGGVADTEFSWGTLVGDLILLGLIPLVLMRLRDMGQTGTMMWIFLGLAYASIASDFAGMVGIDTGTAGMLAGVAGLFMWLWMSMAPTQRMERSQLVESVRFDGYRPGDGPSGERRTDMPDERRW